jgi:AcrR family transcriptional regulator
MAADDLALTRRQQQGARSRREILDVAKRLLAERGYTGMTVSRLSEMAGLSTSSIYWHFGSKDGVLAAVVEQGLQEFFAKRPRAADFDGEPLDRMAQMLKGSGAMLEAEPEYLRLLLILTLEHHEGGEEVRRVVSEMRESSLRNFEAALTPLVAPDGDEAGLRLVHELALLCRAVADGAFIASLDQEDVSMGDIYSTLVMLLRGLASNGPAAQD